LKLFFYTPHHLPFMASSGFNNSPQLLKVDEQFVKFNALFNNHILWLKCIELF